MMRDLDIWTLPALRLQQLPVLRSACFPDLSSSSYHAAAIMSNIAATLKQQKEDFVSGLNGGSVGEVNAVSSVAFVSLPSPLS